VRKFIFPSSVSAYGPELPYPVREDFPLGAHTLPYAVHKQESDDVVRGRAESLGECSTFVLRPNIFTGATMQNYLVGALRGTPTGRGRLGKRMRDKGKRLPMLLPFGAKYLEKRFQFVHVDDMARLIVWILRRADASAELVVLNVAGRGEPLTLAECARIADSKIKRLPGRGLCRMVLQLMWDLGISGIPPEALPYMIGSYTMNTRKLQEFLGPDYERVIQHTVESALRDSFRAEAAPRASAVTVPIR
jgi:nucleoside-diphosphate-sugar epimerase